LFCFTLTFEGLWQWKACKWWVFVILSSEGR
jgi:hypothetical protein